MTEHKTDILNTKNWPLIKLTNTKIEQKFYDGAQKDILNTKTDHGRTQNRHENY